MICFCCPVLFGAVVAVGALLFNSCTHGLHHDCGGERYIQIYRIATERTRVGYHRTHMGRIVSWLSPTGVTYHHVAYPGRTIPYIRLLRRAGTPSRRDSSSDKSHMTIMPRHTHKTHLSVDLILSTSRVSQTSIKAL